MTSPYTKRLPAEWEAQSTLLLSWPHKDTDWHVCLEDIHNSYLQLVAAVTPFQAVLLLFHTECLAKQVLSELHLKAINMRQISHVITPYNDTWIRDYGPLTITDNQGRFTLLDCEFNAWGSKYDSQLDNHVTRNLMQSHLEWVAQREAVSLVIEGGSIDVNGTGDLITTSRCLLNPSRNPGLTQQQIEEELQHLLGIKQVLWLNNGYLEGDDTDAHIDTLVRFINQDTLVYTFCDNIADSHYKPLQNMLAELKQLRQENGKPFHLIPLPLPTPIFDPKTNNRLPATYANFIFVNGAVIVPSYNCEEDAIAIERLSHALPQHKIVSVDSRAFIRQYGSLHCSCMQIPKGALQLCK